MTPLYVRTYVCLVSLRRCPHRILCSFVKYETLKSSSYIRMWRPWHIICRIIIRQGWIYRYTQTVYGCMNMPRASHLLLSGREELLPHILCVTHEACSFGGDFILNQVLHEAISLRQFCLEMRPGDQVTLFFSKETVWNDLETLADHFVKSVLMYYFSQNKIKSQLFIHSCSH